MSLARRLAGPALALSALCGAMGPAHAQTTTASLTVDNVYGLYWGKPSALTLVGSNAVWETVENYSFTVTPESYVYVAAWDQGSGQGFQGVVSGPNGTFRTNLVDWVATVVPAASLPGWSPTGNVVPALGSLQAALSSASWNPILASRPHNGSPWGAAVSDPATLWIWSDSIDGGTTDGSLVVFRTATPVVTAIPEPSSALMMLVGAGALGFMYRRRMQPQGSA